MDPTPPSRPARCCRRMPVFQRYCPYTREPAPRPVEGARPAARTAPNRLVRHKGNASRRMDDTSAADSSRPGPISAVAAETVGLPGVPAPAGSGRPVLRLHERLAKPSPGHLRRPERRLFVPFHLHRQAWLWLLHPRKRGEHDQRQRVLRYGPRQRGYPRRSAPIDDPSRAMRSGRASTATSPTAASGFRR